ncbi:MAG: hypothetical protein QM664_11400 [Flavihumibacter sp.]
MSTTHQTKRRLLICLPLIGIALVSISWLDPFVHGAGVRNEHYRQRTAVADTTPRRSLDDHLSQIREAREKLRHELTGKDWDRVQAEMESTLERLHTDGIERELQQSLSGLNRQMGNLERQHLQQQLQFDILEKQLKNSAAQLKKEFRHIDTDAAMEAAHNALLDARNKMSVLNKEDLKADMDQLRQELKEQLKNQSASIARQQQHARRLLANQRVNLRKSLDKAVQGMDKAEKQMEGYKTMISELRAAGLINDAENYEIECRKGILYIDGKEQPAEISKKYSPYFPKENTRISNRRGNWNLQSGLITD